LRASGEDRRIITPRAGTKSKSGSGRGLSDRVGIFDPDRIGRSVGMECLAFAQGRQEKFSPARRKQRNEKAGAPAVAGASAWGQR